MMAIPINKTWENVLDVAGAEIFSEWKKNASLCVGSVHSEMLTEFITKNKFESNFSTNPWPLR